MTADMEVLCDCHSEDKGSQAEMGAEEPPTSHALAPGARCPLEGDTMPPVCFAHEPLSRV